VTKYDRLSIRVAVFFKSDDGTVLEFNQIFAKHIFGDWPSIFTACIASL